MAKTVPEQIRSLQDDVSKLEKTVGIGKVSTVDRVRKTASVILGDGMSASEPFPVLNRGDGWLPDVGQYVAYIERPGGDGIILGGIG